MCIKKLFIFITSLFAVAGFVGRTHAASTPVADISDGALSSDGTKCEFTITVDFGPYGNTFNTKFLEPQGYQCGGDTALQPAGSSKRTYTLNCSIGATESKTINVQIPAGLVCSYEGTECVGNLASTEVTNTISCGTGSSTTNPPATSPPVAGGTAECDKTKQKPGEECFEGRRICVPGNTDSSGKPVCCGISLLTNVPFIGKCIQMISAADEKTLKAAGKRNTTDDTLQVTESTAFPRLMLGLTKILVTVTLLASFIAIIVAGVMIAASGAKEEGYSQGTKLIGSVIAALALLGASGVILRLINPNFFG